MIIKFEFSLHLVLFSSRRYSKVYENKFLISKKGTLWIKFPFVHFPQINWVWNEIFALNFYSFVCLLLTLNANIKKDVTFWGFLQIYFWINYLLNFQGKPTKSIYCSYRNTNSNWKYAKHILHRVRNLRIFF
jgi:hypothetical protein